VTEDRSGWFNLQNEVQAGKVGKFRLRKFAGWKVELKLHQFAGLEGGQAQRAPAQGSQPLTLS
jgi:hypothetical protein